MEQKLRCDISIGPNLQKLRHNYGISQEKLCAMLQRNGCDIGRTTYAKYENGELNVKSELTHQYRYGFLIEKEKQVCHFQIFHGNLKKYLPKKAVYMVS